MTLNAYEKALAQFLTTSEWIRSMPGDFVGFKRPIYLRIFEGEDCSVNLNLRCPSWLCGYGWGEAGDEDVAELFVEDIGYPATVCVGDHRYH